MRRPLALFCAATIAAMVLAGITTASILATKCMYSAYDLSFFLSIIFLFSK